MPASLRFDDLPFGFSWVVQEPMQRTSHALAVDGRVWLIDPVDEPAALERAAAMGEPAGVIQLLDRHKRDCAQISTRLGVPHVKAFDGTAAGPFEVVPVLRLPVWKEVALWWAATRTLVVAEAVGTHPVWAAGSAPAGIHFVLRLRPPRKLSTYRPEHLLVGHGMGVHGRQAAVALDEAFARSRRDLPRALLKIPSSLR
ncbi:MAG: hypothetical protein H0V22_11200 [Solirubrobacterales bacterium]|jgi:hypothetical protein|nr:hypothetical protein [Solirubrobacterales bacterium]